VARNSLVVLLAVLVCILSCSPQPQKEPPLTPEGKEYARSHLQLSEVGMKAADSYARQTLTEVEGKVKNSGDRTVDRVDIFCLFYDRSGVLVLKERAGIVKKTLKPGETRSFRLAFDDIPQSWNNDMPKLVIAQVIFG
jgi:hypothetical protein